MRRSRAPSPSRLRRRQASSPPELANIFEATDTPQYSANEANEAILRKKYLRAAVDMHNLRNVDANLTYLFEKLMRAFKMFRLMQLEHPGLTMASVTRQGPSAGQHPAAAPETASPWNVQDILQESMPTIVQATRDVVSYLDTAPQTLHAALRTLQVGCDCTFRISDVEQPAGIKKKSKCSGSSHSHTCQNTRRVDRDELYQNSLCGHYEKSVTGRSCEISSQTR